MRNRNGWIGFAFDRDGDRCVCGRNGQVLSGDHILCLRALSLAAGRAG
ncbi:MAG: hypothetical protein ACLRSW_07755 [Christensenellaceae bacterium]